MNIQETDKQYIANTYNRFPITLVKGKGSLAWDENGKEYIDLGGGIAVNSFGFCDDEWISAVTKQANTLQHTSNLFYSEPCAKLAEMLCTKTGMKKVFFSNSGAEANECAIKIARKYAADKKGKEYSTIISLNNSFHGRTLTTLAATGQDIFHEHFTPLTPGFVSVDAGNYEELIATLASNKCAGIILEVVQGEGGVIPLDKEYLKKVETLCKEKDLILICDEVQIGNGRSGELYGYMTYGIEPDVVSTAKGLAGGLPLGATLLSEKVENVFTPGLNGSTFGGNPVACSGALSILKRIDGELLLNVRRKSEKIFKALENQPGIKSVTGLGLMIGILPEGNLNEFITKCHNNGVIVISAHSKVRLLPALNIPDELLDKALDVIKTVAKECI